MLRLGLIAALLALFTLPAGADTQVGKVGRIQGSASATLAGKSVTVAAGGPVFLDQMIKTGAGARLMIEFVDGTQFTVGEKSSVTIDRFVFDPASSSNAIKLGVVGPFRFITGKVGKAIGSNVSIRTASATLGIRGTDVWGGRIDNQYGVFLAKGIVTVSAGGGQVVLSKPGSGTNIANPGALPGPVKQWPEDKVARALATVTFR
jgi:hypothetical protein